MSPASDSRRVHALIDHLAGSVTELTPDLRVRWAAGQAWKLAGYEIEQVIGRQLSELPSVAKSVTEVEDFVRECFDGQVRERAYASERTGRTYWMTAVPLFDGDEVEAIMLLNQDVTDRTLAEARVTAILEAAPDGLVLLDGGGAVRFASRAFERLVSRGRDDLTGVPLATLVSTDPGQPTLPLEWPVGEHGLVTRGRAHHGDGDTPVELHLRRFPSPEGDMTIATIRDDTARRRAEHDREAAVVQAQEAAREAVQASRVKDEFVSRMSHELRTPLTAVLGFSELLSASLDGEHADQARLIHDAAQHLSTLVADVLDVSRVQTGNLSTSPEAVGLDELIDQAARLSGTTPATVTGARDVAVHADRTRTLQILVNLLTNAERYGDPPVDVEVAVDGRQTRVIVRDAGPGISTTASERVFEPFVRLSDTGPDGTGLGLTLARSLARTMGGDLELTSLAPVGARFELTLPSSFEPAPAPAPRSNRLTAASGSGQILVLEDNPRSAALVQAVLRLRPGVRTHLSASATGYRDGLGEAVPDLVLVDLHLPDGSGLDVVTDIRRDRAWGHTTVVVVTADATPATRGAARRSGADAVLTKPYRVEELLAVVDDAIARGADGA